MRGIERVLDPNGLMNPASCSTAEHPLTRSNMNRRAPAGALAAWIPAGFALVCRHASTGATAENAMSKTFLPIAPAAHGRTGLRRQFRLQRVVGGFGDRPAAPPVTTRSCCRRARMPPPSSPATARIRGARLQAALRLLREQRPMCAPPATCSWRRPSWRGDPAPPGWRLLVAAWLACIALPAAASGLQVEPRGLDAAQLQASQCAGGAVETRLPPAWRAAMPADLRAALA